MVIRQGEVYWVDIGEPWGSQPGYRHPHVVLQNDVLNQSKIRTVVICALTTNLKLARLPGSLQLPAGEANLPEASVVNVTQIFTVDKEELQERLGQLSEERFTEILAGVIKTISPLNFRYLTY